MRYSIRGLMAFAVLLASFEAQAQAGGCYNGYCYQATYTPYVAPSYSTTYQTFYQTIFDFSPPLAIGYSYPRAQGSYLAFPYAAGGLVAPQALAAPEAAHETCETKLKALKADLDDVKALMRAVIQGKAPETTPPVAPAAPSSPAAAPPALPADQSILLRRCASCHDSATAKAKGKDIVLTKDGKTFRLDDSLIGKSMSSSNPVKGTMPKNSDRLSIAEYNALVTEFVTMQSQ